MSGDGGTVLNDNASIAKLMASPWDFPSADTGYLTHNIHPYPAKFIPQIPNALIRELSSPGETVADIFCGSGTTLLEALLLRRNTVGIDANPLATLISRAKTTALADTAFEELSKHLEHCKELLFLARGRSRDLFSDGKPFKSEGWRPEPAVCDFWFTPHVVEELAELRLVIAQVLDPDARTLCEVAFSAIIVRVSKQDSDTRYVRREKNVRPGDAVRRYMDHLAGAIPAVKEISTKIPSQPSCRIDTANLLDAPDTEGFDLVVTSPPYPNAYSYHLYHRTRLIWLGHDPEEFKQVEMGSHRKYSSRGKNRATPDTFSQEFRAIFLWLQRRLRQRRYACFVIGNSTINNENIACATLVAQAGREHGFKEVGRMERTIAPTRKAFNPTIGRIKTENILILQRS